MKFACVNWNIEFKGTALNGLAPSVGSCRNRKKTFPSGGAFPRKQSIVIAGSFKHSPSHLNFVYFTRRIQDIKKMQLKTLQKLELPAAADMHVHLRQGEMMDVVVPTLEQGGVDTAFVYV